MKRILKNPMKITTVLVCLFANFNTSAQKVTWSKYLGGIDEDYLSDMISTADNGFILAGSSLSGDTGLKTTGNYGGLDYWLWKMNEKGDLEWQKSFGGSKSDFLNKIILTKDGGFLLAGTSDSNKSHTKKSDCFGETDIWLIKLNAFGLEEWQLTLGGDGHENNPTIVQTKDGGFAIACSSSSGISGNKTTESFGNSDYWLTKLDAKGEIEWQQNYGGQWADQLVSLILTTDGGFLMGGYTNSIASGNKTVDNNGGNDYWLIKIDDKGQEQWQKTYGGKHDEKLTLLIQTFDDGFVIGGSTNSNEEETKKLNQLNTDFHLLKINAYGDVVWDQRYDYGKTDILTTVAQNPDGTFILGGFSKGNFSINQNIYDQKSAITEDYIIVKVDANGQKIWDKTIENKGEDILKKIEIASDGGYLLAGINHTPNTKDKNKPGSNDFWLVKLSDPDKPVVDLDQLKAVPNPTVAYTNIIIGFNYDKGQLTIVDMLGRQIQSMVVDKRIIPIDLSQQPEGVYLVNIVIGNQKYATKIIKQ